MTYGPFVSALMFPSAVDTPDEVRTWLQLLYSEHVMLVHFLNAVLAEARKSSATAIADVDTSNYPADTPADADALRDDLVANYFPHIDSKIDGILAALRTNGQVSSS